MTRSSKTVHSVSRSETAWSRITRGCQVKIVVGVLDGVEGTVVEKCISGRLVLRLGHGLLVEIDEESVERV